MSQIQRSEVTSDSYRCLAEYAREMYRPPLVTSIKCAMTCASRSYADDIQHPRRLLPTRPWYASAATMVIEADAVLVAFATRTQREDVVRW